MNTSCYGKTLESKRHSLTVQLVTSREHLLRRTDTPIFCDFKIFNGNLADISSRIQSVLWNMPTIVGAVVLDLAKYHMFDFHYNVMKKHLNCLCYTPIHIHCYTRSNTLISMRNSQQTLSCANILTCPNTPPIISCTRLKTRWSPSNSRTKSLGSHYKNLSA